MERLQKLLARAGLGSRRQVEELIRSGRVTVDGRVAQLGDRADLEQEAVKVDGRRILPPRAERRYLLLNKPPGYITSRHDPQGRPTVFDLLPARLRPGLMSVGRLDYGTEGLLLLTDDGDLAHHVAHPRYGCAKTYEVKVKGRPEEGKIATLKAGIRLYGQRVVPLAIAPLGARRGHRDGVGNSWWKVVLGQGRTRQVREMFFRIGHPVMRLRRVAIGPIADPHLPCGGFRQLRPQEVELLRRKTARAASRKSGEGDGGGGRGR